MVDGRRCQMATVRRSRVCGQWNKPGTSSPAVEVDTASEEEEEASVPGETAVVVVPSEGSCRTTGRCEVRVRTSSRMDKSSYWAMTSWLRRATIRTERMFNSVGALEGPSFKYADR